MIALHDSNNDKRGVLSQLPSATGGDRHRVTMRNGCREMSECAGRAAMRQNTTAHGWFQVVASVPEACTWVAKDRAAR